MNLWQAWTFEGHTFAIAPAAAGACPAGLVAVRRFYNNPTTGTAMNHRYVASGAVANAMRAKGRIDAGIVMCAQP
ncbi:MAG: hypothetical protein ABI593_15660 [Betaproteobacteria bacterium]